MWRDRSAQLHCRSIYVRTQVNSLSQTTATPQRVIAATRAIEILIRMSSAYLPACACHKALRARFSEQGTRRQHVIAAYESNGSHPDANAKAPSQLLSFFWKLANERIDISASCFVYTDTASLHLPLLRSQYPDDGRLGFNTKGN